MDEPVRAWRVEWDSGEGYIDVVFAESRNAARKAADTCGDYPEWMSIRATRAPQFDACQTVADLRRAQLSEGWQFTCGDCEHRVDDDGCCTCDMDAADAGEDRERAPVVDGSDVFCDAGCQRSYYSDRGRSAGSRMGVCLDAVDKWPGITIAHSNGCAYRREADVFSEHPVGEVAFRFPGGDEYVVRWIRGSKTIQVAADMLPAWKRFAVQCRQQEGTGEV